MINRRNGYYMHRPFYAVDPNAVISAGMIAFLAQSGTTVVATTAASGTIPIGTFWKDHNVSYVRSTVENQTFSAASNDISLSKGNVHNTGTIKVTNAAGTVVYVQGVDYTVNTVNGVVSRIAGTTIAATATVVVWYEYVILASAINYVGSNYDRQPDDTLGSGKITVVEGDAAIYTDQFDVNQTYTLNAPLRSNVLSQWTTAALGAGGTTSVCGRVIQVPSAADAMLGIHQIRVAV